VRDERSHPLPSPQFCVSCFGPGSCEVTVHPLVVPLPSLSLRTRDHREGWVGFLVRSDALLELLVPLGGVASRLVLGHQNLTLAHALQSLSEETKHGIPDLADREENRLRFGFGHLMLGGTQVAAGPRLARAQAVRRAQSNASHTTGGFLCPPCSLWPPAGASCPDVQRQGDTRVALRAPAERACGLSTACGEPGDNPRW
jgi:hypothetical protein